MNVRRRIEEEERARLSPWACRSADSRGRQRPATPDDTRTVFQRDRDHIIHSRAFRRLKDKTQVFVAPQGAHVRTRLTHTLEVSQIARTIARGLMLNEDLTEAVALGHDLGHTPFGHAGERVLNEEHPGGFRHNEQSLRVVDELEGGVGLNLTFEVRDGIVHHTGPVPAATLEGRLIHLADRIAYVNHDLDDAIRGGVLTEADVPKPLLEVLGRTPGERIGRLVEDVLTTSLGRPVVEQSPAMAQAMEELRQFLFAHVYVGSRAKREEGRAQMLVRSLYRYYTEHPEEPPGSGGPQAVLDYVAGMTDRFAIASFRRLFLPEEWRPDE